MPTLGTVKGDLGYQDYDFLQLGVGFESNLMGHWDLKTILIGWENEICTPSSLICQSCYSVCSDCSQLKHRHLNDSPWKLKSRSFPRLCNDNNLHGLELSVLLRHGTTTVCTCIRSISAFYSGLNSETYFGAAAGFASEYLLQQLPCNSQEAQ